MMQSLNDFLMIFLLLTSIVFLMMFIVYFGSGTARIEEDIGIGYTKKHLRLWFTMAIIEWLMLIFIYFGKG